ncbi:Ig-like domain-containing protein, partial [Candidatus Margulisiibacteriota bacterium]
MQNLKFKIKNIGLIILVIALLGSGAQAAVISHAELTSKSDSSMAITWSTTDEAATTELLYGIGSLTQSSSLSGTTMYHYLEITDLYPNTTYQYRIKSGNTLFPPEPLSPLTFTTLARPSGEYLFSFAVLNDLRYAEGKANVPGARGIPYQLGPSIITSEVNDINDHGVAFTVVNGNLSESDGTYGDQAGSQLRTSLENLTGAVDLGVNAYKYLPVPGYEDKTANYSTDWIEDSFDPLTVTPPSTESRYGYTSTNETQDSVFNYQFKYKYYNMIFLDACRSADGSGLASLEALHGYLSAESNSKTFVFMSYPGYDPFNAATKDYPVDIPTSEIGGGFVSVDNHADFRATLEAFTGQYGNPLAAAVVSGQLGDNYKRVINDISYVRQGPAVAFPTGYSIYKVYTNGYVKTFYKTKGRDGSDKPYYEHARDMISEEAGLAADILTQFWLGSGSLRNFTFTYPFIPGLAPSVLSTAPVSGASGVSLNRPIIITFNKRMSETGLNNWVSISPAAGTITASFLDSDRTILKVDHSSDLTEGQTYTVTVLASEAKDEGLTPLASDHVFTFNTTGATRDTDPPTAAITPLPDNTTTDLFPSFVGVASDESGVVGVEYRFDNTGAWVSAEAMDGTFNASSEVFKITVTTALDIGSHVLWLRTIDGAGNEDAAGFSAYSFTVAEDKPTISLRIDGSQPLSGDPIDPTPVIELTITAINSLESANLRLDATSPTLTFARVDNNYYATYEVTTALADGVHCITIEAFDILGEAATYEVQPLYVQGTGNMAIQGLPLNYPNPFNAGTENTTISYTLSRSANITINIFNLAGNLIAKQSYSADQAGGRAGYNEVSWDGTGSGGSVVGNGIYIYLI